MNKTKLFYFLILFCYSAHAETFSFVAFGDMPYLIPDDYLRYERLIKEINRVNPSFTVFVGDTKSSKTPCSDAHTYIIKNYFAQFNEPLIYSIGDNEWTDCHRPLSGSYEPIERLGKLRSEFFDSNQSLGSKTLSLYRQADVMPEFSQYVENSYWIKSGFLFVSLHLPGSNNNYGRSQESDLEYHDRNIANLAWIDYVFTLAHKQHLSGVIFSYQADMFYDPSQAVSMTSGYRETIASLTLHSEEFNKPVLLINGDSHRLKIDQPLRRLNQPYVLENVLRLQVMGEDEVQAVEIVVDPASIQPFSFKPLILFENSLR